MFALTQSWTERLVGNYTILGVVLHPKVLICQELARIVNVILQVADALVDLAEGLCDGLAHFLGHQCGILLLSFAENVLKISQLFESTIQASLPLEILVAEALIRSLNLLV